MTAIRSSQLINDVKLADLRVYADNRGKFMETFRTEWFPERSWKIVQTNRSDSEVGVLRGLHYHANQVDYWHLVAGNVRVALADLRRSSSTFKATEVIELDQNAPVGLYIPVGVAHGFLALTAATLTYVVDNYYDGSDEFGIAWNDPDLNINWGMQSPVLSDRDRDNPTLSSIAVDDLPW